MSGLDVTASTCHAASETESTELSYRAFTLDDGTAKRDVRTRYIRNHDRLTEVLNTQHFPPHTHKAGGIELSLQSVVDTRLNIDDKNEKNKSLSAQISNTLPCYRR